MIKNLPNIESFYSREFIDAVEKAKAEKAFASIGLLGNRKVTSVVAFREVGSKESTDVYCLYEKGSSEWYDVAGNRYCVMRESAWNGRTYYKVRWMW